MLLVTAALFDLAWQAIFTPWSLSVGGRPTLTGDWLGAVELAEAQQTVVFLHLERSPHEDGPNLRGMARYCLDGKQGEFEVWGNADRTGQVNDLDWRAMEDDPLWLLHDLAARWQGDLLYVTGAYSYDPGRQHIARSDRPEPMLELALQRAAQPEQPCTGKKGAP